MKQDKTITLGEYLRDARETRGLSTRELSRRTDVLQSAIVKIEGGALKRPRADMLAALAIELDLPLGDVYAMAEYTIPDQLPSFAPYLRAKYGDLPPTAAAELAEAFGRVAAKYGYDGDGPQPGQDER